MCTRIVVQTSGNIRMMGLFCQSQCWNIMIGAGRLRATLLQNGREDTRESYGGARSGGGESYWRERFIARSGPVSAGAARSPRLGRSRSRELHGPAMERHTLRLQRDIIFCCDALKSGGCCRRAASGRRTDEGGTAHAWQRGDDREADRVTWLTWRAQSTTPGLRGVSG